MIAETIAEWYAVHIFPFFPHTVGRLFSPLPFSAAEILLPILAIGLLLRPRLILKIGPWLILLFVLTCGINYQRASFGDYLGLEARPASKTELLQLFSILLEEAETISEAYSPAQKELARQAQEAMTNFSRRYPGLAGYFPRPKPLLLSDAMSHLNLSGIYSPFTLEANYNADIPDVQLPFTLCHELAHLGGYAREDEANFIAYLACRESIHPAFRYSANLSALIYVVNALYEVSTPQEYARLHHMLPPHSQQDLQQVRAFWQQYQGPAADVAEDINNAYLKANAQKDGVQSYGRMVDLLLAYYIKK